MKQNYLAALLVGLTVLAVALTGAMAVSGAVGADSVQESNENQQISVDAVGDSQAQPDKAIINIALRAEGEEAAAIRDKIAGQSAELEDALDETNAEYKTTSYEIRKPYREKSDGPELVGVHGFEITVDNPDEVENIVSVATGAGAEVTNLRMTLSEETRQDLRDEAIETAMDDARDQADTIASTSDLVITGVTNVDAAQRHYQPVSFSSAPVGEDGAGTSKTSIQTGEVSVSYSVQVTFDATS
ncbi:SIMPL domain-containing protein [Halovenus rubra]|uniref:SIMPL domain-containing protein n=2 Tax=Halovenus rubra TaxID=869890 RepID=A0ACC7E135_9EURY|nr:SIMPL domain-containing protein [Halovenus rubra]